MNRHLALVLAVLSIAAPTAAAPPTAAPPAGGMPPDVKAMMERNKKCMREVSAHASKVSFDRKDLEKFLAEFPSFDALEFDDADDDASGPACVDVAAAVANPSYASWARARGLDPKTWLLKSMRITLTYAKRRAPQQAAEMKQQMEVQRREMEKHCKSMGPNACRDVQQAFASGEEMMRESAALWAIFPEPSRAEAALLAEYDARLRQVTEDRDGGGEDGSPAGEEEPGEGREE